MVIWLMAIVTIFVACLLLYVVWRYHSPRSPTPAGSATTPRSKSPGRCCRC